MERQGRAIITNGVVEVPNLVGGRRLEGSDVFEVFDPSDTDRMVGRAHAADASIVDEAVRAATAAGPGWQELSIAERVGALRIAAAKAQEAVTGGDWAQLLTSEQGKILLEAGFEVGRVGGLVEMFEALAEAAFAPEVLVDDVGRREVTFEPFGVVAAVTPWNWPVSLTLGKVVPALIAGNTIVVKPAPTTPLTVTLILDAMMSELPDGVLNVVNGGGDVGASLVAHPGVRKVVFTGSTANGKRVYEAAANGIRSLTLELGGNDPAIVLEDADLSTATLDRLLQATFVTTGQVCWAIKRIYVARSRHDEFVDALVNRLSGYQAGPGLDQRSTMGPLHYAPQREKVLALLDQARGAGGQVHEVGSMVEGVSKDRGHFLLPSIVTGLDQHAPLVTEEQFGPAVPVLAFDSVDDAVRLANDTEYGLSASVWSADTDRAFEVARHLEAGTVYVNAHAGPALDYGVAIGGMKQSGIGREMGLEGLREYCEMRTVTSRTLRPPLTRSVDD